jgi:hypothetical protein
MYTGNSYLELNHSTISVSENDIKTELAVMFSTKSPNGLIFWYGQPKGQSYDGDDFISLAVVDGLLEFSYRLDGEESFTRNTNTRVDNGARHVAILKRDVNRFSLELDHFTLYGETRPTGKSEMFLPGHLFLGEILLI